MNASEYILVLPIEPMRLGDTFPAGTLLPLHCTVMPWFSLASDGTRVFDKLMEWTPVSKFKGLELISKEPALLGPDKNIPVHLVEQVTPLIHLHNMLFSTLVSMRALPAEDQWIGAGYRPHVTDTSEGSFLPGSRYTPSHLVMLRRNEDKTKTVCARWDLELSVLTVEK